jgi:hypothetical protein
MALKQPEVDILKEIISFLYVPNFEKIDKSIYSLDVIINGTDEEKLALVKEYLGVYKIPTIQKEIASIAASTAGLSEKEAELAAAIIAEAGIAKP